MMLRDAHIVTPVTISDIDTARARRYRAEIAEVARLSVEAAEIATTAAAVFAGLMGRLAAISLGRVVSRAAQRALGTWP